MSAVIMNVHTATTNSEMSEPNAFITLLPWSSSELENKRFKVISVVVLFITLAFAARVKWQELPERARADKEKVPTQLTRSMTPRKVEPAKTKPIPEPKTLPESQPEAPKVEKPKPVPPKPLEPKKIPKKEVEKAPPKPVKVKLPTQAEITEQAKNKAKQSDLLAF
jgi:hypothetical protein